MWRRKTGRANDRFRANDRLVTNDRRTVLLKTCCAHGRSEPVMFRGGKSAARNALRAAQSVQVKAAARPAENTPIVHSILPFPLLTLVSLVQGYLRGPIRA